MITVYFRLDDPFINLAGADTFTMITASVISAIAIIILESWRLQPYPPAHNLCIGIYSVIAWRLTEAEYPRTEGLFETSFTLKMYIFQFVNYYATLFYLAFFQPWLSGRCF
jgi:hypothetical protein